MEISYYYLLPVVVSNDISKKINCEKLDRFLALIIDPKNKSFTKEELISKYHYPTEDLSEIDEDWL